jgi:hypothetical protein
MANAITPGGYAVKQVPGVRRVAQSLATRRQAAEVDSSRMGCSAERSSLITTGRAGRRGTCLMPAVLLLGTASATAGNRLGS